MKILSIETSCDETAISIIETSDNVTDVKFDVLANIVLSQAKLHAKYGGVFPNLAKREHGKNLVPVLNEALQEAGILNVDSNERGKGVGFSSFITTSVKKTLEREGELLKQFLEFIPTIEKPEVDAIAVTNGPGLEPALWVGVNFAKALSLAWNVPLVPVNHMEGHIMSALLTKNETTATIPQGLSLGDLPGTPNQFVISKFQLPAIALLISGGHTQLILLSKDEEENTGWVYKIIGETRDDAVGEAFDKVARMLGLPYPGGPEISKIAETATETTKTDEFKLPRPMINTNDFDFSFSGLKTAVLYLVKKIPLITKDIQASIALEFEEAVTEVLIKKTFNSVSEYGASTIIIGGGVSANKRIRNAFKKTSSEKNIELFIPNKALSTDNALMIAIAGYFKAENINTASNIKEIEIKADGNLSL